MLLVGPMNGPAFLTYAEQVLAPKLRPGNIVVMENLHGHKISGVREAIEKAGTGLLFQPPYQPDFNPIEMVFSKLKALLRKAAARTVDDLWSVVAGCLSAFTQEECRHSRIGRPSASTSEWILVARPPHERPMQQDRSSFVGRWRRASAPGSTTGRSSARRRSKRLTAPRECAPSNRPCATC